MTDEPKPNPTPTLQEFLNGDADEYYRQQDKEEHRKAWSLVENGIKKLQEKHAIKAHDERRDRFLKIMEAGIPEDYRWVKLNELVPSEKSLLAPERQQAVIDLIKAGPLDGYAFFGPPCIGKTVWTTALYRRAMNVHFVHGGKERHFPIWRISTKQMLDEHTTYATTNFEDELDRIINQPTVTPEKITRIRNQQDTTPRLFLEEIDKTKETESRRTNLFAILDAMMAQQGQLVVNSNLTKEEFAERFGADLWWRIEKMCKVVNLF